MCQHTPSQLPLPNKTPLSLAPAPPSRPVYPGYLGWQIRTTSDSAVLEKAKDMHPKLAAGMFFFFALGAVSPHTAVLDSSSRIVRVHGRGQGWCL